MINDMMRRADTDPLQVETATDEGLLPLVKVDGVWQITGDIDTSQPMVLARVLTLVERMAELERDERAELFDLLDRTIAAIEAVYAPDGINFGANLGRGAGAGIPGHLHMHALPRWAGDTNFMTTIAGARVIPESLSDTRDKLRAALS